MGVDTARTRLVILVGGQYSLDALVQASGRCGRTIATRPAFSIFLHCESVQTDLCLNWSRQATLALCYVSGAHGQTEKAVLKNFASPHGVQKFANTTRCRRLFLHSLFTSENGDVSAVLPLPMTVRGAGVTCCDNCDGSSFTTGEQAAAADHSAMSIDEPVEVKVAEPSAARCYGSHLTRAIAFVSSNNRTCMLCSQCVEPSAARSTAMVQHQKRCSFFASTCSLGERHQCFNCGSATHTSQDHTQCPLAKTKLTQNMPRGVICFLTMLPFKVLKTAMPNMRENGAMYNTDLVRQLLCLAYHRRDFFCFVRDHMCDTGDVPFDAATLRFDDSRTWLPSFLANDTVIVYFLSACSDAVNMGLAAPCTAPRGRPPMDPKHPDEKARDLCIIALQMMTKHKCLFCLSPFCNMTLKQDKV